MSFFTDPTISTLTSGTISQNVDLAGLSFPRRFGVRFHMDYLKNNHLVGMQCLWDAYEDPNFEKQIPGKDFQHEDTVSREGWARCYFKGIFAKEKAYIRLRIRDSGSEMLIKTFYFEFQKDYQTSYDGKTYMKDPILGDRIVKNGFLTEMVRDKTGKGPTKYRYASSTFMKDTIKDVVRTAEALEAIASDEERKAKRAELIQHVNVETNVFSSFMVRYQEKCKMVFLVTPPHLIESYSRVASHTSYRSR